MVLVSSRRCGARAVYTPDPGTKVNWSAALVGLVPLAVVTVTSTVPVPAGLVAVIWVALTTVYVVAGATPNVTEVTAMKLVPVTVTDIPPAGEP